MNEVIEKEDKESKTKKDKPYTMEDFIISLDGKYSERFINLFRIEVANSKKNNLTKTELQTIWDNIFMEKS